MDRLAALETHSPCHRPRGTGVRVTGKFVKKKHLSKLGGEERRLPGWQKRRHKTRQMWVVLSNISHALLICVLVYFFFCLGVFYLQVGL